MSAFVTNPKNLTQQIIPWLDVVIISAPPEEVTEQGVAILQETEEDKKRKPEKGILVAKGIISKENESMKKLLDLVDEGDLIFYERYSGNPLSDEGKEFNFVRVKFIMGFKKL